METLASGRARRWVTRRVDELAETMARIAEAGAERVVLCGGDGTFMSGVTALEQAFAGRELPTLIRAPAGTVATVARNFGHRSDLLSTVRRAVAGEALPEAVEHPTLRVSEQGGGTRIGFMFGTGLVARFFERYYAAGGDGYATAARLVARIFVGSVVGDAYSRSVLDPLPCTVSVEGRDLAPAGYSLIMSSVVKDLGLHMYVNHRAGEDPERPHLVASPLGTRQLGPQAPRVLTGRPLRGEGVFDDLVREFSVRFPGEGGPYVLDGDVLRARQVTVSAGPRIRVITY
jgi:diacylglycerol kinase family enzyme